MAQANKFWSEYWKKFQNYFVSLAIGVTLYVKLSMIHETVVQ